MDFLETINKRRSSRKFTDKSVSDEVMRKSFEAANKHQIVQTFKPGGSGG